MPEQGSFINGRWYTQHALERMAPDTLHVRAILEKKALDRGYKVGSTQYLDYIQPRGIPPSVVEHTIQFGKKINGNKHNTLEIVNSDITVIINKTSKAVITIVPKKGYSNVKV